MVIVRIIPVPPVTGSTDKLPSGNNSLLFAVTETVRDSPASTSVGETVIVILSPSSNTASGAVIDSNTGESFVLATVMLNV